MNKGCAIVSSVICIILICLLVFVLRSCSSCHLQHYRMDIPPWVNHPIKLRHIEGWIYKFHCPEIWLESQPKRTVIGLAIVDREDNFILNWQRYEITYSGYPVNEFVEWEDYERFNVVFYVGESIRHMHISNRELVADEYSTILRLIYTYDKDENRFKLLQMVKGRNGTVKKIDGFPSNWRRSFKSQLPRPHLLDK